MIKGGCVCVRSEHLKKMQLKVDSISGLWRKMPIYSSHCLPPSPLSCHLCAASLRAQCSAPACCSGQTGSSSASCRRTSGGTLPSTDALPHLCCLGENTETQWKEWLAVELVWRNKVPTLQGSCSCAVVLHNSK